MSISNLKNAVNHCTQSNLFVLIIYVGRPKFLPKSNQFMQNIGVIDSSVNLQKPYGSYTDAMGVERKVTTVSLTIWAHHEADCLHYFRIGDILMLKNYNCPNKQKLIESLTKGYLDVNLNMKKNYSR